MTKYRGLRTAVLACLMPLFWAVFAAEAQEKETLRTAWEPFEPYQYTHTHHGIQQLTGLDVQLLREAAKRAGFKLNFSEISWQLQVEDIHAGVLDVVAAASLTPEREKFALFSIPYRPEMKAIFVKRGESGDIPIGSTEQFVNFLKGSQFRLGVIRGWTYGEPELDAYIANDSFSDRIVVARDTETNLRMLLDGTVDGALVDRIVGATFAWKHGLEDGLRELPFELTTDVRFMFSKYSITKPMVDRFDTAIRDMHQDGTFHEITKRYMFPVLLSQTLDSNWFFIIDLIGTAAFAVSGLLLAYRHQYDIFGAFVLASLPAVGGGVTRDLLTNREKLAIVEDPIYILTILGVVLAGYLGLKVFSTVGHRLVASPGGPSQSPSSVSRLVPHVNTLIQTCDALGLAAFTVTGVVVALGTQSEPLWLWGPILAAVTGAGGGILRDVLRSDPDIPSLKGELYPEIAFVWGGLLSFFLIWEAQRIEPDELLIGIVVTLVGVFVTRMLAIYFGWRSPRFSTRR